MRLYLVRHGRTAWNERGVYRGSADVALSASGRADARAAARALAGCGARLVWAAPLSRARDTGAAIAASLGARLILEPGFGEVDRGAWTGLTPLQARRRFPAEYEAWLRRPSRARFSGGESVRAVQRRVRAAFARLERRRPPAAVVVSHNVALRALLCSLLRLPLDNLAWLTVSEASVTELEGGPGRWRLIRLNDTCHLGRRSAGPAD